MADFVVLATADGITAQDNKQHTARSLHRAGHRVLYIESLGLRPRADRQDRQRIVKRLRRMFSRRARSSQVCGSGHR